MPRVVIFVALMSVRALATDEFADIREQNALLARQLADTQARLATLEKFVMSDVGASVSDGTHSDSHPTDSVRTGGRRLQSPSNTASITYQGGALNFDSDIIVRGTINATGQISKQVVAFLVTATQDSSFTSNGGLQYVAFDSVEFNRGGGYDYSDTSAFKGVLHRHPACPVRTRHASACALSCTSLIARNCACPRHSAGRRSVYVLWALCGGL